MAVSLHTTHFRFGIDQLAESTHGWLANIDTNLAQGTIAVGTTFLLRFCTQETGGTQLQNCDNQFQCALNGGTFQNITTSSTIVKAVAAAAFADGDNCTSRLGGTGTFESSAAGCTEDGLSGGASNDIAASGNSETECGLQIVAANVVNGDVITFRLTSPDTTIINDVVPSITVAENAVYTPTTKALTITKFAPVIGLKVIVGVKTLTLATFAPSVTVGKTVTPTTKALTLSTFAPTVTVEGGASLAAVITVLNSTASRMLPHVVHVHATASTAGTGTLATCLYKWTFSGDAIAGGTMTYTDPRPGKSGRVYNGFTDQVGFNAACICRSSGTLTIDLEITNEIGETDTDTTNVTIVADTRTVVYCDEGLATGSNDGSSEANAFQDFETDCVPYMQASGAAATRLRLNRGKTYVNSTVNLMVGVNATNVWIDAYGTGANPLVTDTQTAGPANCWDIRRDAENVFIEDIDFQGHSNRIVNAIRFRADTILRNIAIIGFNVDQVSQATNTTENPGYTQGFLQLNCHVDNHLEYGFYGEYDDFVSLGCTSTNAQVQNESATRTSGFRMSWDCLYSKYYPNASANKDAFRVMTRDPTHGGEYIWVTRSYFVGPVQMAWNSDVLNPGDGKFQVIEDSLLEPNDLFASNTWFDFGAVGSAYEDCTVRNCVFYYVGNAGTTNPPLSTGPTRTSTRLVIIDNTLVIRGPAGLADLISIDTDGDNTRMERNLLISSSDGKAYFFKAGSVITAGNNVWYKTGAIVNVNGEGDLTLTNWNARSGTATDFAQTSPQILYSDINADEFAPDSSFTTVIGSYTAPAGARTTDYNNRTRTGTAGAAEVTANVVCTPTTKALTLATFAPTVTAGSSGTTVTPTTAALALSTFAPTVSTPRLVTPTTKALVLATFAPSVNIGIYVTPSTKALTLSTFAPTVTATDHKTVTPTTKALTLTTFAPTVSTPRLCTPTTKSLSITPFAPTVSTTDFKLVTPGTLALTITRYAPTVISGGPQLVTPGVLALTLTMYAPTVSAIAEYPIPPVPGDPDWFLPRPVRFYDYADRGMSKLERRAR